MEVEVQGQYSALEPFLQLSCTPLSTQQPERFVKVKENQIVPPLSSEFPNGFPSQNKSLNP